MAILVRKWRSHTDMSIQNGLPGFRMGPALKHGGGHSQPLGGYARRRKKLNNTKRRVEERGNTTRGEGGKEQKEWGGGNGKRYAMKKWRRLRDEQEKGRGGRRMSPKKTHRHPRGCVQRRLSTSTWCLLRCLEQKRGVPTCESP